MNNLHLVNAAPAATREGAPVAGGFVYDEAKAFVEFCVDLDNQDDRVKHPNDAELKADIDPALWDPTPVYDSRRAVAIDVVGYQDNPSDPKYLHWKKLYAYILGKAKGKVTVDQVYNDPDLNGFGPWQNAWTLYQGRGINAGAWAVAVRGTVFSNAPSAVEDAYVHPVVAGQFLSEKVRFAADPLAQLHSGFAHGTFTTILDERYGILAVLQAKQPAPGSRLFIVGHSQGASMATLVHAFMHYAMRADDSGADTFGLKGQQYRLKSYAIAQPKPGNGNFAADFSRHTQREDIAIVINNNIDPVPQVPLTLQSTGDLAEDFRGKQLAARILRWVSSIGAGVRGTFGRVVEPFVKESAEGYSYFYRYDNIKPLGGDKVGSSWEFVPAGHVIYVYGTPSHLDDMFYQHHATTYRKLIREQLR